MFEERKNLLNNMARATNFPKGRSSYAKRAEETEVHIQRIRDMLVSSAND